MVEAEIAMARRHVLALLVVQAAAFWPVWGWAGARVREGDADEIVALLAAAAALLIAPRSRAVRASTGMSLAPVAIAAPLAPDASAARAVARVTPSVAFPVVDMRAAAPVVSAPRMAPPLLALPTSLTLGYALATAVSAPPLLRAMIAACALLATWCAWRWNAQPHPAALGLVLLALPALPTAQFVLGFPLRAAAGELAARLLGLSGLAVVREGVSLRMGDRLVAIDAPCSGVNMLWMAVLLALVLAVLGGASAARTALLVTAAGALAIAGNALRAASLFLIESGIAPLPGGLGANDAHVALGVVAFTLAAAPLLWMARRRPRGMTPVRAITGPGSPAIEVVTP